MAASRRRPAAATVLAALLAASAAGSCAFLAVQRPAVAPGAVARPSPAPAASASVGPGGSAAAVVAVVAVAQASRRRARARCRLRAAPAAWRGDAPLQSTLAVKADGSVDYEAIDRSPVSVVFIDAFRGRLADVTGHAAEAPGFEGMMELVRRMSDMGGTAEAMQRRALRLFQDVLPAVYAGWVPGFWKGLVQPALPMWATSYAFVKICQNFFPWLVGPMHGEDFVDIEVPEHWRRVLFFLPEFVRVPQTATAERCRFLESAQCASVCVNICKAPSQAWLSGDFGMPVHIEPNYDDLSCRWRFGVTPPPLLEDDAVKAPCFKKCPSKTPNTPSLRERLRAEGPRPLSVVGELGRARSCRGLDDVASVGEAVA